MATGWYYELNGQQFGPCSRQELAALVQSGTLSDQDCVWSSSRAVARSVAGVLRSSGMVAHVDRSASTATVTASASDHDIPDIADFLIEGSSDAHPAPTLRQDEQENTAQPSEYFLKSNGTTIGPLSDDALKRLAVAGKIQPTDSVRVGTGAWTSAVSVPELADLVRDTSKGRGAATRKPKQRPSGKQRRGVPGDSSVSRRPQQQKARPKKKSWVEQRASELRREREREAQQRAAAPAPPVSESVESITETGSPGPSVSGIPSHTATPVPAVASQPSTAPSMGMPASGMPNPMAARPTGPPKGWTPPRAKRSSSFDWSQGLLYGGIGTGVVLLIIAVVMFMPSFGGNLPGSDSVATGIETLVARYESAASSDAEWDAFAKEVRGTAGGWVQTYTKNAGQRTPDDIRLQEAATALIQLANSSRTATDKHEQFLSVIQEKLTSS